MNINGPDITRIAADLQQQQQQQQWLLDRFNLINASGLEGNNPETGLFQFTVSTYDPALNKANAGTWNAGQKLGGRNQDHLPRGGTTYSELNPPTPTINQRNLVKTFSQLKVPFPRWRDWSPLHLQEYATNDLKTCRLSTFLKGPVIYTSQRTRYLPVIPIGNQVSFNTQKMLIPLQQLWSLLKVHASNEKQLSR